MLKKVDLTKIRICKICGEEYQPKKATLTCRKCSNEKARLNRIKYKAQGKIPADKPNYPFSNVSNQASLRFNRIQKELRNAWKEGPEAVKRHYDKQLKEAEELGIMEWIFDRRTTQGKRGGKTGRPSNDIKEEYPSTKNMPY